VVQFTAITVPRALSSRDLQNYYLPIFQSLTQIQPLKRLISPAKL
jgi:hypothetical protein